MNIKGWSGILIYFAIGCCGLAAVGYGVSKIFDVQTTTAKAQPKGAASTSTAPPAAVETLPGPEDVDIGAPAEMPAAPDEEATSPDASAGRKKINLGILEGIIEQLDYQGVDKRDPFAPFIVPQIQTIGLPVGPVTELERYELEQLRLVGIIWGVSKPKALFLDPNQKTYVVYNKTRIGRNSGYVAEIREGEVVVIEAFNNEGRFSYQPRIIKLQRE